MSKTENLELPLDTVGLARFRESFEAALKIIDAQVAAVQGDVAGLETDLGDLLPAFDPIADEGKVLKIVSGELAWAADETGA